MSITQAKTQVIGKEKRGSSPSVRPQPRNVTKSTNASKPVISTANSRTPKPTTNVLKTSSTVAKPTNAASTSLRTTPRTSSSSTTRNVEKPPTLNQRGSFNNATSSSRIQRSLSTATNVGQKVVQPKSVSSLKTIDKNVPRSQKSDIRSSRSLSGKTKDDNVVKPTELETEPERISFDDQEVSVPSDEANVIEETSNIETKDDDCLDKTRDEIEPELDETEIEHERDEAEIHKEIDEGQIDIEKQSDHCDVDENELNEGENVTETTIESKEENKQEEESFLKASEIRKRMEAQAGNTEAVTPWKVVQGGGGRPFVRKEVAAPVSNEVIEETTSKLIKENKRNRVLAMVGAFETVMSNQ